MPLRLFVIHPLLPEQQLLQARRPAGSCAGDHPAKAVQIVVVLPNGLPAQLAVAAADQPFQSHLPREDFISFRMKPHRHGDRFVIPAFRQQPAENQRLEDAGVEQNHPQSAADRRPRAWHAVNLGPANRRGLAPAGPLRGEKNALLRDFKADEL